jgi:hypothetical protein
MTSTLNQLVTMVAGLQTDLRVVKEHSTDLAATVPCQESEICQLRQKESSYHAENSKLQTLLTAAKAQVKSMRIYVSSSFALPAASTYLPQAETTFERRRSELEDVNEEEEPEELDINEDDVNDDDVNDDGVVDTPATNTPADGGSNLSSLFFSASISASSSH